MASLDGRALVFTGFMGAGKSTLARRVASALGETAVDADSLIEAELGTTIAAYFEEHGEEAFREREAEIVGAALERADGGTFAVGGGSLKSERVRAALERHAVVLIDVDFETAWRRVSGSDRPLAADRDHFARLHSERQPAYTAAADAILPGSASVATLLGSLEALAVLRGLPKGVRMLWADAASGSYPVWVGRGLLGGEGMAAVWPQGGRRFCITDANVAELHAGRVPELAGLVEIEAGEEAKTLQTAETVWSALADMGATRADRLVAVGGGVVGDLAGFCAAAYQRGIPVVQVPTTLVAQVDSAYGGKTGVDLPEAKNFVGAYHQPEAVVVDTSTLATLPPEEHAAGYAEVVKTALIAGGPLWDHVGAGGPVDDDVVFACARTKLGIVMEDERDGGRRQVLNLGHTIGHAIETVTGYGRYRHGEAVALGLLAALRLSGLDDLRTQVAGLFEAAGLPTSLDGEVGVDAVVEATARDKKRQGETTPFVLVGSPGDVTHGHHLNAAEVRAAVAELGGS